MTDEPNYKYRDLLSAKREFDFLSKVLDTIDGESTDDPDVKRFAAYEKRDKSRSMHTYCKWDHYRCKIQDSEFGHLSIQEIEYLADAEKIENETKRKKEVVAE